MKALLSRAGLVAAVVLGLAAAAGFARFGSELFSGWRVELGARHTATLDPALVALIQRTDTPLTAMLFITADEDAPSERRGLQADIAQRLLALKAALPGRFEFGISDPTGDPDAQRFAARRGVTPFRAIGARGDTSAAHELYATLLFDWGPYGSAHIEHLGPEHVPALLTLIRTRLTELLVPSPPRIVLLAPADAPFGELAAKLAQRGTLTRLDPAAVDFDWQAVFTGDVVFWMQPGPAAAAAQPELERLVDSGRALVIAGSPFGLAPAEGVRALVAGLGLAMDATLVEGASDDGAIHSIAPDQDFRHLVGQPNGDLAFVTPAGIAFDSVVLDRRGSGAQRLASSRELPGQPKRALAALIEPADARRGRIAVFGAATPFTDGWLARAGTAHQPLVKVLVDSFTGADRRALLAALPLPPRALPAASSLTRLGMRAFVLLPFPLFLVGPFLVRRRRAGPRPRATPRRGLAPLFGGLALVLLSSWLLAPAGAARWDWTRARLSVPADVTLAVAAALGETQRATHEDPLGIELFASPPSKLPSGLDALAARLGDLVGALEGAGLAVESTATFPEDLSLPEREALERSGIVRFQFDGPAGLGGAAGIERRSAWAGVRLTRPGAAPLVLSFESGAELDELEFRLALALESSNQGRRPRLGFASDLPRASAAEDYEFQSQGNFAPREGDVFGRARRALERAGFEVQHINPRARRDELGPALGAAALDGLVWLQPRRDTRPMLEAFAQYLTSGGRALVAAQHFRTQARQYRGAGYETVFWPQPQLIDVDRFWLDELGVKLVREVRFDSLDARLPIATRVTGKSSETEFAPLVTRAPFLVRVPTAQFEHETLLAGVADLELADPTALRLDAARLEQLGLTVRPLFHGSTEAWRLDWSGGWLPPEVLVPPTETTDILGPDLEPLFGVVLDGAFPAPVADWDDFQPAVSANPSAPGRLILLGNSACFTDEMLGLGSSGAEALLLNAAADLCLADFGPRGTALAHLAGRRPAVRGLGLIDDGTRGRARLFVLGGGALWVCSALFLRRGWRLFATRSWRARGGRVVRVPLRLPLGTLASAALLALVAFGATRALAATAATDLRGELRFGRVVPPAQRAKTIAAVHLVAPASMGGRSYTYAHQTVDGFDVWRELEGHGALGDPEAIVALIEDLFEAEGQVVGQGDEPGWRVELLSPLDNEPPFLVADIGRASPDGRAVMLRIDDQPDIWSVDRNPRYRLEGTLDANAARERLATAPPLADRRLVPAAWPGNQAGLVTLAWQRAGEKSLRLTEVPVERTPEELQAGERPLAWNLIGEGQAELLQLPRAQLPGSTPAPDEAPRVGATAELFLDFVGRSEYSELLDPEQAPALGLGPGMTPWAILLFVSRPTAELPKGSSFTISIGPPLPASAGGGHAATHGASQNLVRLSSELVKALLPTRADLHDPLAKRRWPTPR